MDCMLAKALKSSLRREFAGKSSTQQLFFEDFVSFNAGNGLSGDDFSVDDLLDFSNGELQEEEDQLSVSSDQDPAGDDDNHSNFSNFSAAGSDSDSLLATELAVPVDDVAELEWVSQFVDDSLQDFSPVYGVVKGKTENYTKTSPEPEFRPTVTRLPCFSSPLPCKARTKRARTAGKLWMTSLSDSSSTSSEISSSSCLTFNSPVQTCNLSLPGILTEPVSKKQKEKQPGQTGHISGPVQFQRRCSHCQVQKTPQWRTGPLGAKTLCNACGVRFKSGRLYPEYRPACSPTFSMDVHSNSHRKVLEMRKKKEVIEPDSGLNLTISSF